MVISHVQNIMLYIVLFLHQTTTFKKYSLISYSCISYYSYIKPQLYTDSKTIGQVVYRTIPTSNHNPSLLLILLLLLYIVLFLHQTTTHNNIIQILNRCISYYSYIKPQLPVVMEVFRTVVYRTIPTSNHNCSRYTRLSDRLYIVLFLHQTTTWT